MRSAQRNSHNDSVGNAGNGMQSLFPSLFTQIRQLKRRSFLAGGAIALFMLMLPSQNIVAQTPPAGVRGPESPQATEAPQEPADPLGRTTPQGTLIGFLQAAQTGKYKEAAAYLQLSKIERAEEGETLAHDLHELMNQAFVGHVGSVSNSPEGTPQAGVPQDREQIGTFRLNHSETTVELVHVPDAETGKNIWLFSSHTLQAVPELYSQIEESKLDSALPRFLSSERVFSTPLWRWIAFLLLIPVALLLSSAVVSLLRVGIRIWLRKRPHPMVQDFGEGFKAPAKLILTIVFHWIGVLVLGVPLLFREYYRRFAVIALVASSTWLIVRLINSLAERARVNALADSGFHSGSIILLGQRILTVVVIVVAGLVMLSIFGFDMTTAIAGLGIGSIALAFAAQKTLENLLGGISILGDQVIRVGETCRVDDKVGVVEDISLRSTRIRTLDSAQLSIPNGQLANMNIENLSRYERNSFRTTIGLALGTSPDQLRSVLARMRILLQNDPRVDAEGARVRLIGFGESSLDVEISCHILTPNWNEFLAIREDLLLRIMELFAESGTELALPSRALHLSQKDPLSQRRPPVLDQQAFKRRQGS